jgi:hypothetical protein
MIIAYSVSSVMCKLRLKRSIGTVKVIHESEETDPGLRDEIHPGEAR